MHGLRSLILKNRAPDEKILIFKRLIMCCLIVFQRALFSSVMLRVFFLVMRQSSLNGMNATYRTTALSGLSDSKRQFLLNITLAFYQTQM